MGEDEPQDEIPWQVNEYHYEPPLWLELLFSPLAFGTLGVPLAVLIVVALWRWLG
jgi:hypothetical protein